MSKLFVVIAFIATWGATWSQEICEKNVATEVGGKYIVITTGYNENATQCLEIVGNGFRVTKQDAEVIAPVYYPRIYFGCEESCTPNSPFPRQISELKSISAGAEITYNDDSGFMSYYRIGLGPDLNQSSKYVIPLTLNSNFVTTPVGNKTAVVNLGGQDWSVYEVEDNEPGISYIAEAAVTSLKFDVLEVINDAISRGHIDNSWYISSLEADFLIFIKGTGMAITEFEVDVE